MQLQPVGLTSRLVALILDAFIAGIPAAIIAGILVGFDGFTKGGGKGVAASIVVAIIMAAYEILLVSKRGATFGMSICGFKISSSGDQAAPVTIQQSAIRYVVKTLQPITALASASSIGGFLGLIWDIILAVSINGHPEKRGYHDRAAGTWALTKPAAGAAPPQVPNWVNEPPQ